VKLDVERVCRVLLWIGCVWFAFTAFWGVADLPTAGHLGAGSAVQTMAAEASLRWHTFYPLWDWYRTVDPGIGAAYTHHPFGVHWMSAVFVAVIGHHDIVCNLPAAMMSATMPPMLYRIGKRAWGPVAGTATALAFVILPITVGFSIFHNVEVITMFGTLLFYFGAVEYPATGLKRHLVACTVGVLIATSGDWPGYLLVAPVLGWAFLRAHMVPSWMVPRINKGRDANWWAWSVVAALFTFMLWMGFYYHADRIAEWLAQGKSRGGSADVPLKTVLETRKNWIDFSFTPLAIAIGKLAVYLAVVRLIVRRRDEEILSLAALFGAVVQYVIFKRGADIHIFWPHYFGIYYALVVGQLVATASWLATAIASRVAPTRARLAGYVAAGVMAIPCIVMIAPDGVRSLSVWRRTGGKYDDKGALWSSDVEFLFVLEKLGRPLVHPDRGEGIGRAGPWGWEQDWALGGLAEDVPEPSPRDPMWIARARELGPERIRKLSAAHHVRIYGQDGVVVVMRGDPQGPLDAYSLSPHEPNVFQWMFTNNTEPVRTIPTAPDPFMTWEWRVHYDQPASPPTTEPQNLEEIRIAHNVAVAAERMDEAERLRQKIVDAIDRQANAYFADGSEMIGVQVTNGVDPQVHVYIKAGGPTSGDSIFQIRSTIVAKNPLSLIPINAVDCDHAEAPALSTRLWKKGFIYEIHASLHHRIGREKYVGMWIGGPRRTSGPPNIDLVEVP
jgi:hypothetical protein